MCSADAVALYLNYRKSLLDKRLSRINGSVAQTYSYSHISIVDTGPPKVDLNTSSTFKDPVRLKLKDLEHILDKDVCLYVDAIAKYLINCSLHSGFVLVSKKRNVQIYKNIFGHLKGKEFNRRLKFGYSLKFSRKTWAWRVRKVVFSKSRTSVKRYIYKLINCFLYIKECIWGVKFNQRCLKYLLNQIPRCKNTHGSWENVRIFKCSKEIYTLLSSSYLVSNVLFADNDLFRNVMASEIHLWRSFDPEYVKEIATSLLLLNILDVNKNGKSRIDEFKTMLNRSFNECLYRNVIAGNTGCVKYVRQFYAVMNMDVPLNPEYHLYRCFPYNLTLENLPLEERIQDVIFIAKSLLHKKTKSNVWRVVQMLSRYFSQGSLKFGYLECCYPYTCVKCTGIFTSIYCGLFDLLVLLRSIEFYSSHLLLARMLIKYEIQRIRAGFWRDEACLNKPNELPKSRFEPFINKSHIDYGWKLQEVIREKCLLKCLSHKDSVAIRQRSITHYKKCPVYLRLLSAIYHHISMVDVTYAIEKLVDSSGPVILEHLGDHSYRTRDNLGIFTNDLNIKGPVALIANIYMGKMNLSRSLSSLIIKGELNIIERTQACLSLSRNLNLVDFTLPQIVQSVAIDPGNRVLNLLNTALTNENVSDMIYYYLACLVHSTNPYVTKKAATILVRYICMKIINKQSYIFNKLPKDSKVIHREQILFHGKLLSLSRALCDVPVKKRSEELSKHIKILSDYIKNGLDLHLFKDSYKSDVTDRSVAGINEDSVKLLKSATRSPFVLSFKTKTGKEISYIYKMRDDLRQDNLVVQLKSFMLKVFAEHNLDIFLQPFLILPYSSVLHQMFSNPLENENISPELSKNLPLEVGGIVGLIPGTVSRHQIGKDNFTSLVHFFVHTFGDRNSPKFSRAIENFIKSLAGYSLLCFLLQVKDRHNGNLLLSDKGHIIHIDFGFILGTSPAADVAFEQAPFKLTKEMIDLLGGTNSRNFKIFANLLVNGYLAIRAHANVLLTLVELMQHSTIACFRNTTLIKLKKRLKLQSTPQEAKDFIIRKIYAALHSKTTILYDVVQGYQQGIKR
ncbi:phosphatidylinositol 4-kinase family protein [Theileria equi strain WA]|uniref:1-phosphatidylinositol 4-kinase n=1 Tax=Theileria equi strain WA TaxID=1537102 RepID=L0AZZ6_THEEQ|nr:phosphatidylinositol 4-kinase family protein [Theileria equi strain WA]AFZ81182.1 phosphatidylinositol 4-kinase family protein [Theileria equi strain WA]|eukprot:XP_004830848.1 phosphatidylinositol 4-kinase family protein [Theileria equi strain WA]